MRAALPERSLHHHLGVAYGAWAPVEAGGKINDETRARWLSVLATYHVSPDYGHAFKRWRSSFRALGDRVLELELRSRLLIGHGNPSATDVGLTVHHTWSVPVIPGSALKGLLAHFVDAVYGPEDPDRPPWEQPGDERERARYQGVTWKDRRISRGPGDIYRALFGAPDADDDRELREHHVPAGAQRGHVIFHDALYIPADTEDDCPFAVDVLTVHQKDYYNSEGKTPPNDYDSPNPVGFLSVRPGARMLLALSGPPDWTELAERLLLDALAAWGVGGKTSSGYGRLARVGDPDRAPSTSAGAGAARTAAGTSSAGAGGSQAAPQEPARPPSEPTRPLQPGDRITLTREDAPPGKIRFRAPNGVLCNFASETPPDIAIGATVEVWIANLGKDSYTVTRREDLAARLAASTGGARRGNAPPKGGPPKGRRR
jgi:CRISPR-associated protein Cmr6